MPASDETNNFATHGKAPIPSDATGSFVIPRDKEVGPKDNKSATNPPPIPASVAPQVVTVPPATGSVGIAAPPAGAAFITAPSPSATMAPMAQAPTLGVSPFAAQPMAAPQQVPMAVSMQQIPLEQQLQMMSQQQMMPQQIIPQQPQMMPQQMPMQQQMMPQMPMQQMAPQQVSAPISTPAPTATMSASPSVTLPAEMTPSRVAQMQAQILANALIASQNASRTRRKQTYQKGDEDVENENSNFDDEPTQQDIRDKNPTTRMPSNITHGERIILPIHDVTLEQHREDMSRRMKELLGDEAAEPETISTKSVKKKQKELEKMKVRNATQASEDIGMTPEQLAEAEAQAAKAATENRANDGRPTPAEQFPSYTLSGQAIAPQDPIIDPLNRAQRTGVPPIQPQPALQTQIYTLETQVQQPPKGAEQQQYYVEQEYQPKTPSTSSDITSRMQAAQIQSQAPEQIQSMDPRIAAIQQQQLMLAEQKKIIEQQMAEEARALAAAEELRARQLESARAVMPQVQANSGRLNPNRKSIRVNADVVKKAALASMLKRPASAEPEPEPVEAIRPAYVEELEHQLAGDMKKEAESEMSALMAAELADDELTQNAAQIKVVPQEEIAKKAAAEAAAAMPDEILRAIENTNTSSQANPNISGSPNINAG